MVRRLQQWLTFLAEGCPWLATAHGTSLQSLLDNPILNGLVGRKHEVIVGDA